ncbi:hypothetical protein B0J14DRAFT_563771 [Halenospora varia]|nr:hypothetical protein B0J14DRAFT_563771 [Halenospora varia]
MTLNAFGPQRMLALFVDVGRIIDENAKDVTLGIIPQIASEIDSWNILRMIVSTLVAPTGMLSGSTGPWLTAVETSDDWGASVIGVMFGVKFPTDEGWFQEDKKQDAFKFITEVEATRVQGVGISVTTQSPKLTFTNKQVGMNVTKPISPQKLRLGTPFSFSTICPQTSSNSPALSYSLQLPGHGAYYPPHDGAPYPIRA